MKDFLIINLNLMLIFEDIMILAIVINLVKYIDILKLTKIIVVKNDQ